MNHPRLRHCTLIQDGDTAPLELVIGKDRFELTEEVGSRTTFLNFKRYLDGRHSIKEIAGLSGVDAGDAAAIVQQFREAGFLQDRTAVANIPVPEFLARIEETAVMWKRQIGFHKLFGLLETAAVRKEVFVGLLLETYHYVNSATRHIATALAYCNDDHWRRLLSEYLPGEDGHAAQFIPALERCGLRRQEVIEAHPLIGTLSLRVMLEDIGRRSTLAYFACTTLFEAHRESIDSAAGHLTEIGRNYGLEEATEAFINHMREDVAAGHVSLLTQALAAHTHVPAEQAHEAVNCMHDLKHCFDQFYSDILTYYSDISNYIPRLKVDYFAL